MELPQGSPGWGDIQEAWFWDALGFADAPGTQCAEPAQDILGSGDALEARCAEPAPSVLAGCSL